MSDNEEAGTDHDFEFDESVPTPIPRQAGLRPRSVVWEHFTVIDKKNQIAVCNICDKKLSFKTTVTNLKKHVIRKHPYCGFSDETSTPRPFVSAKSASTRETLFSQQPKRENREIKHFDLRKTKLTELGGLEGLVLNVIGDDGGAENLVSENEANEEVYTQEIEYSAADINQTEKSLGGQNRAGKPKPQKTTHLDPYEIQRKSRIMDLQLECLEIKKYNMQLESLMLEQQLNIRRSIFTEPLHYADTVSRGIQTDVGGENTRVFYLADGKGGVPKRHLFAMQDLD